jgi:hypothetical protein
LRFAIYVSRSTVLKPQNTKRNFYTCDNPIPTNAAIKPMSQKRWTIWVSLHPSNSK